MHVFAPDMYVHVLLFRMAWMLCTSLSVEDTFHLWESWWTPTMPVYIRHQRYSNHVNVVHQTAVMGVIEVAPIKQFYFAILPSCQYYIGWYKGSFHQLGTTMRVRYWFLRKVRIESSSRLSHFVIAGSVEELQCTMVQWKATRRCWNCWLTGTTCLPQQRMM